MNIQKTIINTTTRQLSVKYTMEPIEPIGDQIADTLAKEIQEEIDWGIVVNILSTSWTLVEIKYEDYAKNQTNIVKWVTENCKDEYKNRTNSWLFKSKDDAAWFILRWS